MIFLGETAKFKQNAMNELMVDNLSLLLIYQNDRFYLIENKCGHFGLPLNNADLSEEEIICPHHGISFNLVTGKVANRPYENCDNIRIFKVIEKDTGLYLNQTLN